MKELETRRQQTDEVLLLCGNWGFIIITEIYLAVTRNRGNSAFCTVIGFTVTGIVNSSVTFCTVLVNVFFRGNGWHGNYYVLSR